MKHLLLRMVAALVMPALLITAAPQAARANAASTAAWAAAAAVIVGAIMYDSHHRPYWRDHYGHVHYVSPQVAGYYQSHHWNNVPPSHRRWQGAHGNWHHGCCG